MKLYIVTSETYRFQFWLIYLTLVIMCFPELKEFESIDSTKIVKFLIHQLVYLVLAWNCWTYLKVSSVDMADGKEIQITVKD